MIRLTGLSVAAYASTNLDNLLLLCGFFAHPAYSPFQIVVGQFAGIGILVAASVLCALAAVVIPLPCIGFLGLFPIFLGCSRLVTRFDVLPRPPSSSRQIMAVTAAAVANGGDNIATYVPIFAGSTRGDSLAIVAVFAVLTGLWCWMAEVMVKHPITGYVFRTWSARLLPIVLIAVGLIVLWRNGSFDLIYTRRLGL
ncbi:MAG: cadmium resistance transporter [Burkholderiaceae bacterium]